jgi:poly(3-hydroxyalkanoate) synthetase
MNLDTLLFDWPKAYGSFLQSAGRSYIFFSQMAAFNPFMGFFSAPMEQFGRFLLEKGTPLEPPSWYTPNRIVYEGHKIALRKFNSDSLGNPILFVAPEAGHDSHIVDYGPGQSLVQCAREYFPGDVFAVEKLPAGPQHTGYSIDDCILSLKACIDAIGEPVHLVGLCQGGWQSAIFAALFPADVKTLTLAAAPIDFHAGDAKISEWARSLPMSFYRQMVAMGGGNMPGCFIVQGFMLMNPYDRFVGDHVKLLDNIADEAFVDRNRQFFRWYYHTQPVPGKMYLQIVEELFQENKLVQGRLEVLGKPVHLGNITQPLYLVGGRKDDITPPPQLFAAERHVQSKIVRKSLVPAGHIGVFMAKQVIRDHWSHLLPRLIPESLAN